MHEILLTTVSIKDESRHASTTGGEHITLALSGRAGEGLKYDWIDIKIKIRKYR